MSDCPKLRFTTLDVFTSTRFSGNPLAIVQVPKELKNVLSQMQKQTIAREFNLSETVFVHQGNPGEPINIDIQNKRQVTFRGTSINWEWMVPSFRAPNEG